jgi:pyrroline-5-carboxylate reductase
MKLGLIGCGKMGGSLLKGIIAKKLCRSGDVIVRDADPHAVQALQREVRGVKVAANGLEVADRADVVLVCVKPADCVPVMTALAPGKSAPLLISIAAGVKLDALEKAAGRRHRVVRVMPNTPAMVGAGASAYSIGKRATAADAALTEKLLGAVGSVTRVDEKLLDAVTGLSGSGPAYMYTVLEALADGGVLAGLPRETALHLAAQTMVGAAQMVLKTRQHPAALRDQVASPGGTTIAGLAMLEKSGLRSALIEAVRAAAARSVELGR